MSGKLLSLVDNLSEGSHNKKCKECGSYRNCIGVKHGKLRFKSFNYRKKCKKAFNKKSVKV